MKMVKKAMKETKRSKVPNDRENKGSKTDR